MFTPQEYQTGWLIYGGLVVLFNFAWWFLTAGIGLAEVRQLLRLMPWVLLCTPWYTDADSTLLAPAWAIASTDLLFDSPEAFWRAGTPLLFALALALTLVSLLKILGYLVQKWRYEY